MSPVIFRAGIFNSLDLVEVYVNNHSFCKFICTTIIACPDTNISSILPHFVPLYPFHRLFHDFPWVSRVEVFRAPVDVHVYRVSTNWIQWI